MRFNSLLSPAYPGGVKRPRNAAMKTWNTIALLGMRPSFAYQADETIVVLASGRLCQQINARIEGDEIPRPKGHRSLSHEENRRPKPSVGVPGSCQSGANPAIRTRPKTRQLRKSLIEL